MAFDFDKAQEEGLRELHNPRLFCVLLGPSGGGKSRALGTTGGKTLYCYFGAESHGPKSASANEGSEIIPMCLDTADGKMLDADATMTRIADILKSSANIKKAGFKTVALDGVTELEVVIRNTSSFKMQCKTKDGGHDKYREGPVVNLMIRQVTDMLRQLQRDTDCHIISTCLLDVKSKDDDGSILESTPQLQTYQTAQQTLPTFGDILVVGRVGEDGEFEHKFQMMAGVVKTSTDTQTKRIKKTVNYSPRISLQPGVQIEIPEMFTADFRQIIKWKEAKK